MTARDSRFFSVTGENRGTSDVLGYVLVFALITATIGTVFVVGVGGLDSYQQAEQVNNVERAFDVLADNVDDLRTHSDRSRGTEMRLAGGTIGFGEPSNVSVGLYENGEVVEENNTTYLVEAETEPIVFQAGDTTIAYELGGVFRSDGGNAVTVSPPALDRTEPRLALTLVPTEQRGDVTGMAGQRTILIETQRRGHISKDRFEPDDGQEIRITVESEYAEAWVRYFEDAGYGEENVSEEDGVVTVVLDGDDIDNDVRVATVEVRVYLR